MQGQRLRLAMVPRVNSAGYEEAGRVSNQNELAPSTTQIHKGSRCYILNCGQTASSWTVKSKSVFVLRKHTRAESTNLRYDPNKCLAILNAKVDRAAQTPANKSRNAQRTALEVAACAGKQPNLRQKSKHRGQLSPSRINVRGPQAIAKELIFSIRRHDLSFNN
jgi:hypothetical protein